MTIDDNWLRTLFLVLESRYRDRQLPPTPEISTQEPIGTGVASVVVAAPPAHSSERKEER